MFWKLWAKITGKNSVHTPVSTVLNQMNEKRALPMGRQEFDAWAERILSGALIPSKDKESLIYTLAGEIMHLGPVESHKEDAFFIHRLRKLAINEVALSVINEIKEAHAKRKEAQDVKPEQVPSAAS